jgi:hypothetical protein
MTTPTLQDYAAALSPRQRDKASAELAEACNVSIAAARSWMRGDREPRERVKPLIDTWLNNNPTPPMP